jgi:hypothetical protein
VRHKAHTAEQYKGKMLPNLTKTATTRQMMVLVQRSERRGDVQPGFRSSNDKEGHHGSDEEGRRLGSAGSIPVGVRGARA